MADMTQATDMVAAYIAAEMALMSGKEARLGDRTLRYEDLAEVRAGRQEWETAAATEAARSRGVKSFGGRGFAVARLN